MDDWQAGDLALCVKGGVLTPEYHHPGDAYPEAGRVYQVNDVDFDPDTDVLWLEVLGAPDNVENGINFGPLWSAERFIKVTPPEADEFDRETIDLMNGTPVGEPVA